MQVRCPNCHSTMESLDPLTGEGVHCSGCGEQFFLVGDETHTYLPGGTMTVPPMFGHFRLLDVVGQGSFGTVWRAEDTELDRIVAVKTPRKGLIATGEENQFVREARAAAQLKHPNIVSVHEVGRVDEYLYIVCDFIEGMTLADWLDGNRPASREAAELCVTIAEAMEHAHQEGIIHRDLKPRNILMDVQGEPHIADFGLALRRQGDMTMTFDGQILGTPAYMSPEQARGDRVEAPTDIYAIGVILFELLTGEKPFRGSHRMILQQVINDEPSSPRRYNGSVPRDLETICLKCLEKSPTRRYASAQKLADDLRRFLANEPIEARPVGRIERIGKWANRRPLTASLLSAFVLAVILGISGVTWQWRRAVASQRHHAVTLVDLVQSAEAGGVPSAIDGAADLQQWTGPVLLQRADEETLPTREKYRVDLALIALGLDDEPNRTYVISELLRIAPPDVLDFDELALGTDVLAAASALPRGELIALADDLQRPAAERFRALLMLAKTDRDENESEAAHWQAWDEFTVQELVSQATSLPHQYATLVAAFQPVRDQLLPEFQRLLVSDLPDPNQRFTAASIAGEYASDKPALLCDLLLTVWPEQYGVLIPRLEPHRQYVTAHFEELLAQPPDPTDDQQQAEKQIANKAVAAVTLLQLSEQAESIWPLFRQSPEMPLRTALVHSCAKLGVPPETLVARLQSESEPSIRRALLLALGEYDAVPVALRNHLRPDLEAWYRNDADSGVHSAIAWLLQSWGEGELIRRMDDSPTLSGPVDDRDWYVNSLGGTMIVIDHPPAFTMGAPEGESVFWTASDRQHLRKVDRRFAIGATEVTWSQFLHYVRENPYTSHSHPETYGPDLEGPVLNVSWVQAAMFCRWLSEREKIPPDQMCFPALDEIHAEMPLPDDLLQRTGYRLPTEGEWECACRAGTTTVRFFGDSDRFLDNYGWHVGNSDGYAWRAGLLKPNDYGLFDVYGNAWEWCLDRPGRLPTRPPGQFYLDAPKLAGTNPERVIRGGSMDALNMALRSAQRETLSALHNRNHNTGFRIVRTLPDIEKADSE